MGVRPMLRAIVFDFDGLILDTEAPIYQSWLEVYRAHGQELPFDLWMQTVGSSNAVFDPRRHLEERLGRALGQEVLDGRARRRTELVLAQAVLPGVAELATAARESGLKTGVASSSSHNWVDEHLKRLGILALFECIRCRDDVQRVKPAPDLFIAALDCLGVEAQDALAIEDSPNGVLAAKTAGMLCVAVPNSITADQDFGRADLVLPSLAGVTPQSLAARLGLTVFRCESGSSPAAETRPA
ncbi:MAG TPA: HAD family hydrolase [Candidatus Dormibacteraeota bacterium]|nr:HAD family hydrolase [Candidatus Dormibacteraeota bacterium]